MEPKSSASALPKSSLDIDKILADEISNVGIFAKLGSGLGARFAAQQLPSDCYKATVSPRMAAPQVSASLTQAFQTMGKMVKSEAVGNSFLVSGVVGSGFMDTNPCVIVYLVMPASETSSTIEVRGYAKEGLIKQRTAEKAVTSLLNRLAIQ